MSWLMCELAHDHMVMSRPHSLNARATLAFSVRPRRTPKCCVVEDWAPAWAWAPLGLARPLSACPELSFPASWLDLWLLCDDGCRHLNSLPCGAMAGGVPGASLDGARECVRCRSVCTWRAACKSPHASLTNVTPTKCGFVQTLYS